MISKSVIMNEYALLFEKLMSPLKVKDINLLYRASIDGWDAKDFHKTCDNKGPV